MRRLSHLLLSLLVALGLLAACTASDDGDTTDTGGEEAGGSDDTTDDGADASDPEDPEEPEEPDEPVVTEFALDELAPTTIEDLETYWSEVLPEVYDIEYETLSGGFHAYDEDNDAPSCGGMDTDYSIWRFNAFYCQPDDFIAWDEGELWPTLYDDFGPYAVAMVMAHEFGHAIQERIGIFDERTILKELQADCFAGAWSSWLYDGGSENIAMDDAAFGQALGGLILIRDAPGTVSTDESASPHGSAFDRISAFQDGFEEGAARCAEYAAELPPPLDLVFTSDEEIELGGNLELDMLIDLTTADLNDYFSGLVDGFEPLEDVILFEPGSRDVPECDGDLADEEDQVDVVILCFDEQAVAGDTDYVESVHQTIGDAAVAALLAREWAIAALVAADALPDEPIDRLLTASCLTGAWTRDIYERDPAEVDEDQIASLSPGDLDEIILVYVSFVEGAADEGAGLVPFELTSALRTGFFEGPEACLGG